MILFLVVGDNFGEDFLDVIKDENEVWNNFVIILMYLFGIGKYIIWFLYFLLVEDFDILFILIYF